MYFVIVIKLPINTLKFLHLTHVKLEFRGGSVIFYGSIRLTVTETETDDIGSVELWGGVHIAQRQITTQISIEFCTLVIGLGLGLGLGHCQSDSLVKRGRKSN